MEHSLFRDEAVDARSQAWLETAPLATPLSTRARSCIALGTDATDPADNHLLKFST